MEMFSSNGHNFIPYNMNGGSSMLIVLPVCFKIKRFFLTFVRLEKIFVTIFSDNVLPV